MASLGTGIAGITTSSLYFQQLSSSFANTPDELSQPIYTSKTNSLAGEVFQNCQALDFLTAEKGRTCLFSQKECCFYVNQSGIIRDAIKRLWEHIAKLLLQDNQEEGNGTPRLFRKQCLLACWQ
jgi:hypothetical protein